MSKLFISHSSQDDGFIGGLQRALGDLGEAAWIDSRALRGGDPLWPEIQQAIDEAAAYAVVVSPAGLQSRWVGKELKHALEVQQQRGRQKYPVIPLSLDGTKLGVLEEYFGGEVLYVPVSSKAGGIEAALHAILVAMGKRLPTDPVPTPQPPAEPVEELVLHLTDLKLFEEEGKRRASARARLVYEPAAPGQPEVSSEQSFRLIAPLGPIEADELRWYLERYAIWPSGIFRERSRKVEENLEKWGQLLYEAALPKEHTANVMAAWAKVGEQAGRRFSIHVDAGLEAGAPKAEEETAHEAATLMLGLPWELLHDGRSFLFQGANPIRVRRRLPNTAVREVAVVDPPIRILLVTARPEDDACGYIDHRASALPLVAAMESLGGLVHISVLDPPTLSALGEELARARKVGQPYHVVHFDGHGVYDRHVGLGGLCFEDPQDIAKLEQRRHLTVYTNELGPLLRDFRVPLVFLEACQTAAAEKASESVATEMLKQGVASVVAMSHSVLVETARRFVEAFYQALADGNRVGAAMLAGQRKLRGDTLRGRIFGAGELRLQDWFVPVLYQEKADPQLFKSIPAPQTKEDVKAGLKGRLGKLPDPPATGFVGRSREMLALQRLLKTSRYALIRGQGGEGKTALAAEFARWMVRSQQIRRAAFVTVEGIEQSLVEAVLDRLGQQLCRQGWSTKVDCGGDLGKAEMEIARVLVEQPTLLVVDNVESILPPPYIAQHAAIKEETQTELAALLGLCERLIAKGETRIVLTSRELLPKPFDGEQERRELGKLDRQDAVKLVEGVLGEDAAGAGDTADARTEEIEQLVDAVNCHARTLTLLAPSLREQGVTVTREQLATLMAEMDKQFPGSREKSVYASVELSLQRMSAANREKARVLAVFHGGVSLVVLHVMMKWEKADLDDLSSDLIATGLATPNPYGHLGLNPALCPYLRLRMDQAESEVLRDRWVEAMRGYVEFLCQQSGQQAEVAASLSVLELPNLFALLEQVEKAGDAEATVSLTTLLHGLLQFLGKPRLLERVAQARDSAARTLGEAWTHSRFAAQATRIERQVASGQLRQAFEGAQELLRRARAAGEDAYQDATYDLAVACFLLGRVLSVGGGAEQALPLLDEARTRFEAIAQQQNNKAAEGMASGCLTERGTCLRHLGRLDEAADAYEQVIGLSERRAGARDVAAARTQLGTVRLLQRRYDEALQAFEEARELFTRLDEPGTVATAWHQTGRVYQEAGKPELAEDAYRKSLAIKVRLGNVAGQARTLNQLGKLYDDALGRTEEAVSFLRQAADMLAELRNFADEGRARNNLAGRLSKLCRLDEARQEIRRAIECKAQLGHAATPWTSWKVLADIETDSGNPAAAAQAKQKAIECYLAYRRDGGENHNPDGRLVLTMIQQLATGGPAAASSFLRELATVPDIPPPILAFIQALQAIVNGSRDRALAAAPDLDYTMAAEILLLIEALEAGAASP